MCAKQNDCKDKISLSSARKRKLPQYRLMAEENHIAHELEHEKRLTDISKMSSHFDSWDSDCSDSIPSLPRKHSFSGNLLISVTGNSSPSSSPSLSRNPSPALSLPNGKSKKSPFITNNREKLINRSLSSEDNNRFSSPLSDTESHVATILNEKNPFYKSFSHNQSLVGACQQTDQKSLVDVKLNFKNSELLISDDSHKVDEILNENK